MYKRIFILLSAALWMLHGCPVYAQAEFSSDHLKETVTSIGLTRTDTLPCGNNRVVLGKDTIVVRKNENGVIDHVGKQLFPLTLRQTNPLPIYDYMEYVYLNYLMNKDGNQLLFKDVKFMKGGWAGLADITPNDDCLISKIDNKIYQIDWEKGDSLIVSALIPIRYDILSIMSRTEMQNAFIQGEKKTNVRLAEDMASPDTTMLTRTVVGDCNVWYSKGSTYLNEQITGNSYYAMTDSLLRPVADKKLPMESIANIMVLPSSRSVGNYETRIRYVLSNNRTVEQTTTIRQVIDYAMKQGCKPYFGLEGIKDGRVDFTLFLYNENSGYDHIFRLSCRTEDIGTDRLTFSGRGSLFAPTTNVKSLFGEENGKKPNYKFKVTK